MRWARSPSQGWLQGELLDSLRYCEGLQLRAMEQSRCDVNADSDGDVVSLIWDRNG